MNSSSFLISELKENMKLLNNNIAILRRGVSKVNLSPPRNKNEVILSKLLRLAYQKSGEKITPAKNCKVDWSDSITVVDDKIILWYNTPDNSTHLVLIENNKN